MTTVHTPTAARRRLRMALRRDRDAARLTQEQVAGSMDWSLSKVIRIEAGTVSISTNDLRALLRLYAVQDDAEVRELLELARAARKRGWWTAYRDAVPGGFLDFIGLESDATVHRYFQSLVVPGVLQTKEYARIVIATTMPTDPDEDQLKTLVEIRLKRQENILECPDPPELFVVLDESVIHRVAGSRQIMRAQLIHLVDCARRPGITIRVLPFAAGHHPVMARASVVLEFPDEGDDPVLYVEDAFAGEILDRPQDMGIYYRAFEKLDRMALDPQKSITLITEVADGFA